MDNVINLHFDDFDTFTSSVKSWDLIYNQLDKGLFKGQLFQAFIGNCLLGYASLNRCLHQVGTTPFGMRTFIIPAFEDVSFKWRSQQVSSENIAVFPLNGELLSVTENNFRIFSVSMPEEVLINRAQFYDRNLSNLLQSTTEVFVVDSLAISQLRLLFFDVMNTLVLTPSLVGESSFCKDVGCRIVDRLLATLIMGREGRDPKAGRLRDTALKRALLYIEESARDAPHVQELCDISGASLKTLNNAFNEAYGVSAKKYINGYRLNQVRKKLKAADSKNQLITDVANNWGFWHMGQFARDYHRFFGELPSETRKKQSPDFPIVSS